MSAQREGPLDMIWELYHEISQYGCRDKPRMMISVDMELGKFHKVPLQDEELQAISGC